MPASDAGPDGDAAMDDSLCAKYGGAEVVMSVMVDEVVPRIEGDCRVNAFFAELTQGQLLHVAECLGIMGQELFGCPGVIYEGSESSIGSECRSMKEAHRGLAISEGDFDALVEDVVAGLAAAGVEGQDIMAAAPTLLGMESDIVEEQEEPLSQDECAIDGGAVDGAPDAGSQTVSDAGDAG
jgi:hypothetical protein